MLILFLACFVMTLAYAMLILSYKKGWEKQPGFKAGEVMPETFISIIIPARNEEQNIKACLDSILTGSYSKDKYEIIVVDDHSTDETARIVQGVKDVQLVQMSDFVSDDNKVVAFKKLALSKGIERSKGPLIVTTDADCIAPKNWLKNITAIYELEQPVMIVAPVDFTTNGSLLENFQAIDFMSMQGITAAVHQKQMGNMSNGANLAFSKAAYDKVEGYKGIDHLASGDDFLLMMKMQKEYPGQISYLKSQDAIVHTAPQPDWGSFFAQRIRWASKSGKYDDKKMTRTLVLVYLFNLSFLVVFIAGFFNVYAFGVFAGMLAWKTIVEMTYLIPVSEFFGKRKLLNSYPFLQPLHIGYIVVAGFLGMIGKYQWKGRTVR
jgi:cellulose synthase/poly-beta-1,6-N-acetylglucosamine synthase-like glycosyltransferase